MSLSWLERKMFALLSTPDRLRHRLRRRSLLDCCIASRDVTLAPSAVIHNELARSSVRIGTGTELHGEIIVYPPSGSVVIGDYCFIGPGAKLWSNIRIYIGNRVRIAHGVHIFDSNSHSLSAAQRHASFLDLRQNGRHATPEPVTAKPVEIEDDVWIGFYSAILKGSKLGRGCVIGAHSVVTHDVPPYTVVAGNPARKVGESFQ